MTVSLDKLPKDAKALPEQAQAEWVEAYNDDFGWRCSEAHATKAAWRRIYQRYEQQGESWAPRS